MAKNKILAKITMPSAGSAAPYDSAVVGLTTWDQDLVVGGVTYLKGRIIALSKAAASSGDASRGQGGYASPLELSLTIADRCAAGRLWPLVEAGAVPLVGAEVRILNESGDMAPQTWYLHEPKLDGASIKFTLKTMRYLCTKPVSWSATRYDGAATVGLAVGDASVRGINAAGRYKGVSVPTKAFATWEPLQYPGISVSGRRGNPSSWGAMEYGNTTHPYDYIGIAPNGRFSFVFPSQALRDEFMHQYCGASGSQAGGIVAPNSCLLVSDGSNSEIILTSDSAGASSGTATVLMNGADRTINSVSYSTIDLVVTTDGMLASSQASSIQLYFLQQDSPICAGASSVVGFQSKASNASEYGITSPTSIQTLKNNILYLMPTQQATDGFMSWTELDNPRGFVINPSNYVEKVTSLDGSGDNSEFNFGSGKIENISTKSGEVPGTPFFIYIRTFQYSGGSERYLEIHIEHLLNNKSFNFDISKVFVDSKFSVSATGKATFSSTWKWIDPFCTSQQSETDSNASYSFDKELNGPGQLIAKYVYDSVEAVISDNCSRIASFPSYANHNAAITQQIYQIVLYAITKLAFGSNPAVVVPGDFSGTFNPTTTPAMAIDQLAAWAGLSIIQTGGWTPPSGVWGRYLGPDPSSDNSADPLTVTQAIDKLSSEAWMWVAEGSAPAAAPTIESMTPPVLDTSSIDDVVTLPRISYCYAGTSAQFTAEIFKADESFDIAKGDGYFWGGWQEKDACHVSTSPGSAVLAMCQLEDCLAVVCADGYLRCSYDGGTTWPFSQLLSSSPTHGVAIAGNGVMIASTGGNGATVVSFDAGRTWETINIQLAAFRGGWFDETTGRFWLCGAAGGQHRAVWHSVDGITWTEIISAAEGWFVYILAVGDDIFATAQISGAWAVLRNTISGGGSIWWYQQLGSHTDWTDAPHLARWNGSVRIAIGVTLWSSADLLTWTNSATPIALSSFATDGKIVSALSSEVPSAANGNRIYYSRDQGATWKVVRVSPENTTWAQTDAIVSVWDDNAKCFRFSAWGPTRIIALGDPSVLDIWLRCRASYLKTQTLHAETYDWSGVYDADVVVSMLLDAKDGIDTEYEQARIDWMTKQARFATLKVEFADVVEQLSLTAFQKIAIPRQRLEDSLLAGNVPTYGLLTSVDPDPMTGISKIEIIMPPL